MWREFRSAAIHAAKRRPARWAAYPIYSALVQAALFLERMRDAHVPCAVDDLSDVTALVKTFERPAILQRLLRSLRDAYPTLAVLVVDDSRHPINLRGPGLRTLALPYDVGISEGRNRGLEQVTTEFFLLLDDDFVLTRRTGLVDALALMRGHPQLDIMGGQIHNLPTYEHGLRGENRNCFGGIPGPAEIGGLPHFDRVTNFFLARKHRVQTIGWDAQLKLLEHSDFFRRAHGKLTTVFNARLSCLHAMTPFDADYMKKREDIAPYLALLHQKWK